MEGFFVGVAELEPYPHLFENHIITIFFIK